MNKDSLKNISKKEIKFFIAYLIIVYALYFSDVSPSVFLISSGTISTILFSWYIYFEFKNNPVKITPILALFSFPLFMIGISAVYHGLIYVNQDFDLMGPYYISTNSIVIGYIMFATGLFFQFLGLVIFRTKIQLKNTPIEVPKKVKIFHYFIITYIIALLAENYFQLGIIQNFINMMPLGCLLYVSITDRYNRFSSYRYKRNTILLSSSILFISNLLVLSKTNLVFSLLPVFIFYLIHSVKSKKYKIIITGSLFIFAYLLFIQPYVTNARLLLGSAQSEANFSFVSDYIFSGDYSMPLMVYNKDDTAFDIFMKRMFEVNAPAYIFELTQKSGFQNGSTFEYIPIAIVPRIFWPDKPVIPQGQRFSAEMFHLERVNIGMLIVGELYWNYGFIGIIIGSFIIGLSLGYLWKLLNPVALNNFLYFTLYFYLLQACIGGSEFSAVFVGILQLIIFFFVLRLAEMYLLIKK